MGLLCHLDLVFNGAFPPAQASSGTQTAAAPVIV